MKVIPVSLSNSNRYLTNKPSAPNFSLAFEGGKAKAVKEIITEAPWAGQVIEVIDKVEGPIEKNIASNLNLNPIKNNQMQAFDKPLVDVEEICWGGECVEIKPTTQEQNQAAISKLQSIN